MKAIGIDIGTAFIGSARYNKDNIAAKYVRDGFFVMPYLDQRKHMLIESKVPFIIKDRPNVAGKQDIYVIGNEAFDMAVLFGQELRRPLASGVVSAKERDSEFIIKEILRRVAGQGEAGDIAYYSVPADPVDRDFSVIYHREVFKRFLTEMGYTAVPLNEGLAVAWSELEDKELTGLAMSCLTPGQKVFTDRGFVNIEDVLDGFSVLDKNGSWKQATPTKRYYTGKVYKIWALGGGKVTLTADHMVWIMRGGTWQWISAKEVRPGDFTKQPWVNYNPDARKKFIGYEKKTTCSPLKQFKSVEVTNDIFELLGYFLGDGHVYNKHAEVGFTLDKKEVALAHRIQYLLKECFDLESAYIKHHENCMRVVFRCGWFANWLNKHCYSESREKRLPWDVSELSDNNLRFLLKGLIETDGYINKNESGFSFHNTSGPLAQTVYLAMLRLNMCPSFTCAQPREGGTVEGRHIVGKKEAYGISSTGLDAAVFIHWIKNTVKTAKPTMTFGSMVSRVSSVDESDYAGYVYDVSVEGDDHSFCVPGIALHNCGAGMLNATLVYRGMDIFSLSSARAGDWIDQQVAQSRGIAISDATSEKENTTIDLLAPTDDVQEAISIFYKSMLEYSIGHLASAMEKHRRDIKVKEPLNFVVAGGTSMPKGFLKLLADTLKEHPLPIPVGKVWQAKNPVLAVCRGCLKAASKMIQDPAYDGVKDVSNGNNEKHAYPKAPKEEPKAPEAPKPQTPAQARDNEQKAAIVQRSSGGFAEAIDLTMEG